MTGKHFQPDKVSSHLVQSFEKKSLSQFLLHYAEPARRNKLPYVIISVNKYIRVKGKDRFCFDCMVDTYLCIPFFRLYMYISSSIMLLAMTKFICC